MKSFCEMRNTRIFDDCDTLTAYYVRKLQYRNLLNRLREYQNWYVIVDECVLQEMQIKA